MLKVAMIGFGGIAKTVHLGAYNELAKQGKVKLVAVCDIREECFTSKQEINIGETKDLLDDSVNCYTDWHEMLSKEQVDMVDICVPTYLHAPITVQVLNMGYHVLCEKPMSLSYKEAEQMIETAKRNNKQLMIGQCLRFGSKYRYLKSIVDSGEFGKIKGITFRRLSGPPMWSWDNWFMDYNRSHGCIQDLHIHDIDIARYVFGEPTAVSCFTTDVYSRKDSARSVLKYKDFSALVVGDWTLEGMPFVAEYLASFEKATVEYKGDVITVYPRGGEEYKPDVENDDFYYNEIEFFVNLITNGGVNDQNSPESAANTIKLIETLIESSDNNSEYIPFSV